jgi:hypothetical protein
MTAMMTSLSRPAAEPIEMQLAQVFLHSRFGLLSIELNTPS